MQSSYTPEQEAQLTRWGCPVSRGIWEDAGGEFECDTPRQPHDVLAWIQGDDEPGNTAISRNSDDWLAWTHRAGGQDAHGPDPYAATFALAQAVMEEA